jgi:hypothetical protein
MVCCEELGCLLLSAEIMEGVYYLSLFAKRVRSTENSLREAGQG